ncbi:hypothetical protein FA95DRAFT_1537482 [Auriscalpium vulgare]|uniref:Uncharacterized protein n=1 Tax=Auriscalpium vulgare TaxID=40419 RepID=A0ACB8S1T0_9AGAM|nr:hypothetical protein FA95DRAFT_1537482 [Auriscalpium vulgare]
MSYTHHRTFDDTDLPHFPVLPVHAPRPAVPVPSYDDNHPSDHSLPKLGETRCYWTLLSSDLVFVYLDPVLSFHLQDQAGLLVGKPLLDFVHPDEHASAKQDLGNVLQSRHLHGSVTRMRYSRLSRVRRLLGHQGPPHNWADADKIAIDENYMAVDLVINWAAEGLVLCFIHASVDLTPYDNDEHAKTGWSNWCGTDAMTQHTAQALYSRLFSAVPQSGSMSRVFQIMMNTTERSLLLSWPPGQDHGPTARDFAKLAEDVQIGTNAQEASNAKTSCTRRYKSLQNMPSEDGVRQVESIFIPHGSIIFACHKVNPRPTPESMQQAASYEQAYMQSHSYYDQPGSYALPPMHPSNSGYAPYLPQAAHQVPSQAPSHYSTSQHWSQQAVEHSPSPMHYNQWPPSSSPPFQSSTPIRTPSYQPQQPAQPQQQQQQQQQWASQSPAYVESDSPLAPPYRSLSPAYTYATAEGQQASPSSAADIVPPARTIQRRSPSNPRDHYSNGGRSSGNPPAGISKCASCKVTTSPEWRKGPGGKKDLCNACGLRYARSRAKKEGITTQRRRKDKVISLTKQEPGSSPHSAPSSTTPPIAVPYAGLRRGSYDDASFISTSPAGSASGSEVYSQAGPSSFDGLTPSPSPPTNDVSFAHYVPSSQSVRQGSTRNYPGGAFYSSPLSHPPVQSHAMHAQQSERLPHMLSRASPILSSTSSDSAVSSAAPSASYERERHRDAMALPQASLSDPRHMQAAKATFVTQ